jgi:hypothetical protein
VFRIWANLTNNPLKQMFSVFFVRFNEIGLKTGQDYKQSQAKNLFTKPGKIFQEQSKINPFANTIDLFGFRFIIADH